MGALVRLVALASLALVTACAGGDIGPPPTSTPAPTPTPEGTTAATPGSIPTARPRPGPPTTIGDDIGLPHQWTWRDTEDAARQPLSDFCLDPRPSLRPPESNHYRARSETTRRASRTESLGIYPGRQQAGQAILAWRRQAACASGDGLGHSGEPHEWSIVAVTVPGADEAWLGREVGSTLRLRDGRVISSTTVVVRVGTAVYAEHTRRPSSSNAAARSTRTEAEIDSVASYVPTLAPFGESG